MLTVIPAWLSYFSSGEGGFLAYLRSNTYTQRLEWGYRESTDTYNEMRLNTLACVDTPALLVMALPTVYFRSPGVYLSYTLETVDHMRSLEFRKCGTVDC